MSWRREADASESAGDEYEVGRRDSESRAVRAGGRWHEGPCAIFLEGKGEFRQKSHIICFKNITAATHEYLNPS